MIAPACHERACSKKEALTRFGVGGLLPAGPFSPGAASQGFSSVGSAPVEVQLARGEPGRGAGTAHQDDCGGCDAEGGSAHLSPLLRCGDGLAPSRGASPRDAAERSEYVHRARSVLCGLPT